MCLVIGLITLKVSMVILVQAMHKVKSESEVAQSCLTLSDPMDCSPPGSSIHGIFQSRVLEWVTISFSRGPSWLSYGTRISHISHRRFTIWATTEAKWIVSLGCPKEGNCKKKKKRQQYIRERKVNVEVDNRCNNITKSKRHSSKKFETKTIRISKGIRWKLLTERKQEWKKPLFI